MKEARESIPGSGLPAAAFAGLLGASVGLFLVYGGLLWRAPREASHVARFAVSYLAVLPLAAGLLLALRRFTWAHLVTSTGVVWAMKLVITAVLYQAFARGTATNLVAVAPPATAAAPLRRPASDYRASASFPSGALRGHVRSEHAAARGAVVFLEKPAQGAPAPARQSVELVITGSRYAEPLYLAHTEDAIRVVSRDGVLHTAHVVGAGESLPNLPLLPAAGPQALRLTEPGVYRIRCDNHPSETAWIVVVDHPYATRTDAEGAFSLEGVPAGDLRVVAVGTSGGAAGALLRSASTTHVAASETTDVDLDLEASGGLDF